jgi:hypothetical membrane protein
MKDISGDPPAKTMPPQRALARGSMNPRSAGTAGVVGILVMVIAHLTALALSPWFSFWDSDLSDLGIAAVAPLFNWGLIICGASGMWLALGVGFCLSGGKKLRLAGALLLAGAMAMLAAVGIITEAFGLLHYYIAVAFFSLFISASLVLGLSFVNDPSYRRIGMFALLSALTGVAAWFLPSGEGIAIPELAASVPGIIWMGLLGISMANTKSA